MLIFDRQPTIRVVGDVMLDKYFEGDTDRVSPEAPVPVVKVSNVRHVPGGAANVANNIQALGARVSISGICGEDEDGLLLQSCMDERDISHNMYKAASGVTITKNRVISRQQQLLRLDYEQPYSDVDIRKFMESCQQNLEGQDVLVLSDYNKGSLRFASELIRQANVLGIPVVVDPKGNDICKYSGATLVTPNMKEFTAFAGECANEAEVIEKAQTLMSNADVQALLLTRSEQGMTLFIRGQEPVYFASEAQEVFDVTGAGDTVVAALATCIGAGLNFSRAAYIANVAAGLVVRKMGTSTISISELNRALKGLATEDSCVVNRVEAVQKVTSAKQKSERVVFTNGCFDILHPGHVQYLAQAKALGDRLIVGVNSDESVRRLKGAERPINTLEHRMEVLAGLASVDWVVPFTEDTPLTLIESLVPDILVKGGDYKIDEIVGANVVKENGGEVYALHFENGCSTSAIVDTIKQLNN